MTTAAGFSNGVMCANNVCFDGTRTAQMTATDQIIVGKAGSPPEILTLTAGAGVAITHGVGTLVLTAGATVPTTFTAEDASTCTPALNNLNIVGTATNGISTTAAGSTMTVAMASPYADGNFIFENNVAATPRAVSVENNDTDPGSYACLAVSTEPLGGDAYVFWEIDAATRYFSMGIDNSVAGDPFKFTSSVNPSSGADIFSADVGTNTFTHYYGNILQSRAYVANGVNTIIQNTDNTNNASDAFLRLDVGGAVAGDPSVHFLVTGAGQYCMGIDNSVAGDPFKITDNNSPSAGTALFTMTSAGVITLNNDLDVTEGGTGVSTLTSHGILMGNGAGDINATAEPANGQILIGKTGDFPQLGTLTDGTGISITEGSGSITINAVGGGVSWTVETVNLDFTVNKGIIANKAGLLTATLPATAAIGDILEITGINTAVGWRIAQNANQRIHVGATSTAAGVGGYVESTAIRDAIKLVCVVAGASTEYNALSVIGNLTVA